MITLYINTSDNVAFNATLYYVLHVHLAVTLYSYEGHARNYITKHFSFTEIGLNLTVSNLLNTVLSTPNKTYVHLVLITGEHNGNIRQWPGASCRAGER